ncbi:MAG: autophagy protein 5 [Watsoniomyces obsoletus]|nr:MAG: autophagy protein 5 [Watsoniomyces obsoletus]
MAPKNLPPAAKQALVLSYFHKSGTAHSIKDLEKALPSIASINGMQVKDYLQALSDEGKIRVERIGSGNWYWSFVTEEKRNKEKMLESLKTEYEKVHVAVAGLRIKTEEANAAREEDGGGSEGQDRASLAETQTALQAEVQALRAELALYKDNDPMEIQTKKEMTVVERANAERWTDNIYILEQHYLEMIGRDYQQLQQLQQMLYGGEYVEGEGLAEL